MSEKVKVSVIPDCDICASNGIKTPAYADAKLNGVGPWGYVCLPHFNQYGCRLGTGHGQKLVREPEEQRHEALTNVSDYAADFREVGEVNSISTGAKATLALWGLAIIWDLICPDRQTISEAVARGLNDKHTRLPVSLAIAITVGHVIALSRAGVRAANEDNRERQLVAA